MRLLDLRVALSTGAPSRTAYRTTDDERARLFSRNVEALLAQGVSRRTIALRLEVCPECLGPPTCACAAPACPGCGRTSPNAYEALVHSRRCRKTGRRPGPQPRRRDRLEIRTEVPADPQQRIQNGKTPDDCAEDGDSGENYPCD